MCKSNSSDNKSPIEQSQKLHITIFNADHVEIIIVEAYLYRIKQEFKDIFSMCINGKTITDVSKKTTTRRMKKQQHHTKKLSYIDISIISQAARTRMECSIILSVMSYLMRFAKHAKC